MNPNLPSTALDYSNEHLLTLLKNSVAKNTTPEEFDYFVSLCKSTGLNPIKKEIWCIVTSPDNPQYRKVQMMVGNMGFFAIANNHPQYDSIEYKYGPTKLFPLPENDEGKKTIEVFEWIEVFTWRKDRTRPQPFRLYWDEAYTDLVFVNKRFNTKKLGTWAQKPKYMHTKCVESHSLKRAFPQELGDFYSEAEMPQEYSAVSLEEEAIPEAYVTPPKEPVKPIENESGEKVYKVKTGKPEPVEEIVEDLVYSYTYDVSPLLNDPEKVDTFMDWFVKHQDDFIAAIKGDLVASVNPIKKLDQYKVEVEA